MLNSFEDFNKLLDKLSELFSIVLSGKKSLLYY